MTRTRDPLTWLAVLAVGFILGLHAAPNPQQVQDRAVEAEARADTLEWALGFVAARLDTLTDACHGVYAQNIELGRTMAEWPIRVLDGAREAPERLVRADDETSAASAP